VKVVIAADGPHLEDTVAKRFGHALHYLLTDLNHPESLQVIDQNEPDDESHAIIPQLVSQGAEIFITGNIGPHAFELIQSLQGRVALARRMTAAQALDKLQRGELEILTAPTVSRSMHQHPHHTS
jgi:predicted Fe-Mo cluster-binding NifX family protein